MSKALEVATQNQDFLSRSFDLDEMRQDVELFEAMYPMSASADPEDRDEYIAENIFWVPKQARWKRCCC